MRLKSRKVCKRRETWKKRKGKALSSPLSLLLTYRMAASFNYYSSQDSNKHFPPTFDSIRSASNRILKKWGRLQFFFSSFSFLAFYLIYFSFLWDLLLTFHIHEPICSLTFFLCVHVRVSTNESRVKWQLGK